MSETSNVLDNVLSRLKKVKRDTRGHTACCPAHDDRNRSLSVAFREGKVLLRCFAGCDAESICNALGMSLSDLFEQPLKQPRGARKREREDVPTATLAELAAARKLPMNFLQGLGWADGQGVIRIDYKRRDGSPLPTRIRRGHSGSKGVWWDPRGNPGAYEPDGGALAREERYLILCEGESDTATLLYAGFPALGVPGASLVASVVHAEHLEGIERVFYVREPDRGGDEFERLVPARLKELGFEGGVYAVKMPDAAKDPSALFVRDPASFAEKMNAAMQAQQKGPRPRYRVLADMIPHCLRPVGQRFVTGFAALDEATRGGLPLGRFVVLSGAPGAGKSTLATQLVDLFERTGAAVAYLAADEAADGIVMRLGQLSGWSRMGLEDDSDIGDNTRRGFADRMRGRRIAVIDPDVDDASLEEAARSLRDLGPGDTPKVLIVDSLQTAQCSASAGLESARERMDATVATCKRLAREGLLVIGISEMSRAGYRTGDRGTDISALAASKESGAIEYAAALLLGLRSVKGEHSLVDVEIAKNRLGGQKLEFRLRLDGDRASFSEAAPPDPGESDGVANVGNTEADVILDEIRGHVEEGVTMTTIGFGMDNYNDVLMEQLADNGDGFYAYVDDMREAKRLFIDNLTSTLQTIAMDAKVQVDFNPNVVARYRLVGFENRAIADDDFRDNTVDAGEIGAGHSVTALYEVKLYPEAYGNIATVYLRWEDPDTRQVVELSKDFSADDLERDFDRADPYFQRSIVVAEYAEILKESYWAEDSSMADVYHEAIRISEFFSHDEQMSEFMELIRRASGMTD